MTVTIISGCEDQNSSTLNTNTPKVSSFEEALYDEIKQLEEKNETLENDLAMAKSIQEKKTVPIELQEDYVSPYEFAEDLKNNSFMSYSEILVELKEEFPDVDEFFTESEKKKLFPEQMIGQSFPCKAQETAYFFEKNGARPSSNEGKYLDYSAVESNLKPGTDELSFIINPNDTITFLTSAAVGGGATSGEAWKILKNNDKTIIAQDLWYGGIQTLTMSKSTGLGIWHKSNASGLPMTFDLPNGLMIYLQCFIPLESRG